MEKEFIFNVKVILDIDEDDDFDESDFVSEVENKIEDIGLGEDAYELNSIVASLAR